MGRFMGNDMPMPKDKRVSYLEPSGYCEQASECRLLGCQENLKLIEGQARGSRRESFPKLREKLQKSDTS